MIIAIVIFIILWLIVIRVNYWTKKIEEEDRILTAEEQKECEDV